jgi:hypothetical protein
MGWQVVSVPVTLHWRAHPCAGASNLAQPLKHVSLSQLMQTSQNFVLPQQLHCPTCSLDSTSQHAALQVGTPQSLRAAIKWFQIS